MSWAVLERDYLLSWILAAIGRHETLREVLVFKGGTALKKCYFGDYRFSEDLDFSTLPGVPLQQDMEAAIDMVCRDATQMIDEYRFYVTGIVPDNKNAMFVDHKLIEKYNIAMSKWARAQRKERGLANVHYLRHYQFFVTIATKGAHYFLDQEGPVVRDIRHEPIKYTGYRIS